MRRDRGRPRSRRAHAAPGPLRPAAHRPSAAPVPRAGVAPVRCARSLPRRARGRRNRLRYWFRWRAGSWPRILAWLGGRTAGGMAVSIRPPPARRARAGHDPVVHPCHAARLCQGARLNMPTTPSAPTASPHDGRWLALTVLCLGVLMIVLDTTIVNVALPSIRADLGFSEATLAWVVNAYVLTYGGFLLLGGRLGDLFGHRRLFLLGLALFTFASLACGMAHSREWLVIARGVQGLGGAVVTAVALSLIMDLFTEPAERVKAMGVYGFVCAGGGSVGVLLGGLLVSTLSWHWVFLVNLPIGLAVFIASLRLLPAVHGSSDMRHLDVGGAITVTAALILAVYAIVGGNEAGWTSAATLGMLAGAALLFVAFLVTEARVRAPLVPLKLFRMRNLAIANVVGVLWAGAMFAWFFLSALYLQLVLGYDPMQ